MVRSWFSLSASSASSTTLSVPPSTSSQCFSFQSCFSFSSFYYYYYCGLLVAALSTLSLPVFGPTLSTVRFAEGKINSMAEKKIRIDGDVVFGGLFPMHEKGKGDNACGNIKKEKGIQRMEAMLFAVDRINKNPYLLPNIHVGVHILDTCSFDTYALEQSMDFIRARNLDMTDYTCTDGRPPQYSPKKPVVGVIGAASSLVSIMVANILRLFKVSMFSFVIVEVSIYVYVCVIFRFCLFFYTIVPPYKRTSSMH